MYIIVEQNKLYFMKKLIILLSSVVLFSSCTKENDAIQFRKNNILLNDNLVSSKIKQEVNGLTLISELNRKTGNVTITSTKKKLPVLFVRYQSYKGNDLVLNSSINFGRYLGPFVISNYSSIPKESKYMVNVQVRTTTGSNFEFLFDGTK